MDDKLKAAPKEVLVVEDDTNTETLVDESDTKTETLVGDDSMAETLVIEDTNTETLAGDESTVEAIVIKEDTNTKSLAGDGSMTDSLIVEDITAETQVVEDTTAEDDALIDELLNEARRGDAAKREKEKDWILVDSRKGGRPKPVPNPADFKNMLSEPTMKPKASVPLLSKEAIAGKHFYTLREYEKSREYRVLMAILKEFVDDLKKKSPSLENPIRKAICLGIGSFDPPNGSWVAKERAHLQLVAFFAILDAIQKFCKDTIKVIFQEPAFEVSDIEFITSLGHEVVDSPAGFDAVDSTTFVFGIHLYRDIYAQVFKNGEIPALFVGTGWDVWSDVNYRWTHEEYNLDALESMEKTHKKFAFPEVKGKHIFHGTSIYWD